jgi:heptosyltransferase III
LKLLLAKLNHLGDTLLLTPTLRALRQKLPDARIDVVVRPGCEAALDGNTDVSNILVSTRAASRVFGQRYDYAFDLSNSDRAKVLIALSAARVRAINEWHAELRWKRVLFNRLTHFEWAREHQVLRDYRAVADVVGLQEAVPPLVFNTDVDVPAPAAPYAVIHPVSRWAFKEWLPDRWAAVADRLRRNHALNVVFSSGPDARERDYVASILNVSMEKHATTHGRLTLRELGRLIRGAQLFAGVDTVAMHIAAAVQTPIVALFGPSSEWSWRPWQCRHELVLGPCSCKATRNFVCDKSTLYPCMAAITAESVSEAAGRMLA